jgi:FkbM family methyltransferase
MNCDLVQREWSADSAERIRKLCGEFIACEPAKRYLMGRNIYAKAVAAKLGVAAFIDDFTSDGEFEGRPIIRTGEVPSDAFVLAVSGGRPLTVKRLLDERAIRNVDYFALQRWGGLDLPEAVFNEGFQQEFDLNVDQVNWLFDRLADEASRETLRKLMSFRYSYDIACLDGFKERQLEQYFEPFFKTAVDHPVFVDVGGFDGYTTEEFVRRTPDYSAVYIFEPEETNRIRCQDRLSKLSNIHLLPFGAGSDDAVFRFSSDGSASAIRTDGESEIHIRRIDDLVKDVPTFIKMDIEGAEGMALDGARELIMKYRPVLAIAVYHRPSDMWMIPRKILEMCDEYKVYLRHYTESIYETVMYFVPSAYEA